MGAPGDLLLALAGVALALAARLEVAVGTLVAFWLLVPGTLIVPYGPHLLFVDRLVLWALAARLVLRAGGAHEPRLDAYVPTPVHGALGLLVVAGFLDGVVLSPRPGLAGDLHAWLATVDLLVAYVVVLAVARTIGPWRVVRAVAGALGVAVVVGVVERATGHGWSHFFFEHLPASYITPGAVVLSQRGTHLRAQAAAQFALEYGWVVTVLLPLAVVAAVRLARRAPVARLVYGLPAAAVVALVFSGSRSAEVAVPIALVLLAALAAPADRRVVAATGGVVGGLALVALVHPNFFSSSFTAASATDPASVRLDRLPVLLALVAHRPFVGIGYMGVISFGGLDNAYAMVYAAVGVIGLVAWGAVLVTALVAVAGGLRAPRGSDARLLAAACLVGIVAVAVACAVYDVVSTVQTQWALVMLAAVGTASGERVPRRLAAPRRWAARALVPAVGALVGLGLLAIAPAAASQSLELLTVAPWVPAVANVPVDGYTGLTLVRTLCGVVTGEPPAAASSASVRCVPAADFFYGSWPGAALVTVRGPTPGAVTAAVHGLLGSVARIEPVEGGATGPVETGKPAWAVTAPLWLAVAGALAAALVPGRRRRPERSGPVPKELSSAVHHREPVAV